MDYVYLDIERAWGKPPGWLAELPRDDQAKLIAYHRVSHKYGRW